MIQLKERIDRYRQFIYVLKQAKTVFFSTYSLPGRIYRFFPKPTLYINGYFNSEQFNSIYWGYAYKLVESVVSHRKYEDNA